MPNKLQARKIGKSNEDFREMMAKAATGGLVYTGLVGGLVYYDSDYQVNVLNRQVALFSSKNITLPAPVVLFAGGAAVSIIADETIRWVKPNLHPKDKYMNLELAGITLAITSILPTIGAYLIAPSVVDAVGMWRFVAINVASEAGANYINNMFYK